ncbi:hypothetical protein M501DRAFT_994367 [Patellaria atrata CBS 101060]|uniref:Mitochondrial zinc maintenance protein 1, mitochondrial n=1 Tax=Patellaria atrata CBS 101060 TaxID=1346257 RepID=A0A9P4SKC7_9PEZI|nr:hypothetical protein M501DRAFT_994367 [Patellaria atrata CBS 101060]
MTLVSFRSVPEAIRAYRNLLRSTRIAFQGDNRMIMGARAEARNKFRENAKLKEFSKEAEEEIALAQAVATILKQNVVQGKAKDGSNHYELRIHEHTERGDNETVKLAGKRRSNLSGTGPT